MSYRPKSFVFALSIILVIPPASALGQIRGGVGGIGGRSAIGGARPGTGGVRGLSSPRSGLGTRSNPIVNPSPSLTPHQVLNPRGSLSSGQVLNPAPSLLRPRSGGAMPATHPTPQTVPAQRSVLTGGSARRSARPSSGYSTRSHFDELTAQLRQYKNGESWAKYLALPKGLQTDETTEGSSEQARKLLQRFDKLSSDPAYAKVTNLPAFWLAHESLKLKVDPAGTLPPSPAEARVGDRKALDASDTIPTHRTAGEWILQSVVALDAKIVKVAPDGGWQKRLSLDDLRVAVPVLSEQPASDSERKALEEILKSYQAVAKDDENAVVNQLPEFKETLEALQEYLSPSGARLRQDLSRSIDRLGDQLRKYKNGESWAKYLAPPQELVSDKTAGASESTMMLLKRFEKLSSDPTYAKVTSLVAFRPAYEALKSAAEQKDTPPPSAVAVADKKPVEAADPKPIAVADKKPIAVADKKPAAAADKKPVAVADKKPVEAAGKKPVETADPKLVASKEMKPAVTADKKPAAVADKQPVAAADPTGPATIHQSVGERLLKSVVALEKVTPDKGWQKRLSLDDLEVGVSMTSDQPESDSDRKSLAEILETYQAIAKNKNDEVVNQLPEFKKALEALQEYLKPQPPKD